jgi:TolB-like protein/Tfp pilus assembly protein PilF
MGEVYRAHDEQLHREVAIKLLPATDSEDPTARARLLNEARAAAALNHPSICTVHEVGEADGQVYIAMELVEGRPLSDSVRERALPLHDVVRHGRQIADALAHAHGRQILHRDLKSANVVLTADGRAKVLDFGLAKRMAERHGEGTTRSLPGTLTEPGMLVGTVAYMAPEQLRGQPADVRSDVWALGVVLYEMAAGKRPFSGDSTFELSANILNQPVSIPRDVPVALRSIIEKCLEKQPERRYQLATEVSAALGTIEAGTESSRVWLTRRSAVAAAVAMAILAAVITVTNIERFRSGWAGSARIESMAVLPLENLSGDAAQDYFADGMTEVLSTDLARLTGLRRVTARSSVVRYKGASKTLAEIARELNVDALLTGSVHRSGQRVSITAQLLDPATGVQLWTNRYERELQDVLALRNDIVTAIVREINAQLSPSEEQRLASARTVHPEAFEAYLKGRFHWYKQTREDFDLAERYFQLAIDKDPDYALAYAGIASVWFMRTDAGWQPATETFPKAKEFMAKAIALDDDVAELHMQLANQLCAIEWDWAGAEREYRRALELHPNLADAHFFFGHLQLVLGRIEESNRLMQRGLELDPLNDFHRSFFGWHLNYLRRYDEAISIFQRLLPTGPNRASNFLGLWGAYHRKGLYDQALSAAKDYLVAAGHREFADTLGISADQSAYRAAMRRAGDAMAGRSAAQHIPATRVARMYAHAGDNDSALLWLERAYDNREPALMRLGVFWDWVDLHSDARFQDLLRRLKLRV